MTEEQVIGDVVDNKFDKWTGKVREFVTVVLKKLNRALPPVSFSCLRRLKTACGNTSTSRVMATQHRTTRILWMETS